ncbi:MAG: hypothetical protein E7588_09345 [Ruminococcaceae bacterium]|nr:hypothetical protein [Oscillospiraceae bacterium]
MYKKLLYAVLKCTAVLVVLWTVFFGIMSLTALLPYEWIKPNMQKSALMYKDADMFYSLDGTGGGVIHNYADAVLLGVIEGFDGSKPFYSATDCAYYRGEQITPGQALYESFENDPDASYARYWHGMASVVKPLMIFTDVLGIKALFGIALGAVCIVYFALLLRKRYYALAVMSAISFALCRVWMAALCIEYFSCFMLMFVFSSVVIHGKNMPSTAMLFTVFGALTCFFDFLTCETVTLCLPLICLLHSENKNLKKSFYTLLKCCVGWLSGYSLTFFAKWVIAGMVTGRSISDIALNQGVYRMAGDFSGEVFQPAAALAVNLNMMFPFSLFKTPAGIWLTLALTVFVLFCVWYVFRNEKAESGLMYVMLAVALIPVVRILVVNNHSALHPFMTYRALFNSIVAVGTGMWSCTRGNFVKIFKKRKI